MTFQPHHVFVCTSTGAPEAETLLAAGLIEGSPNRHPGQGTANRRFFFQSGYVELLYVGDESEARLDGSAPHRLWTRWSERRSAANPFGICLSSPRGIDSPLPVEMSQYRPSYLPDGRYMAFVKGLRLSEPEVFLLGWPEVQASPRTEPTCHPLGLRSIRAVSIGVPDLESMSDSLSSIRDAGWVGIHRSSAPELLIEFTSDEEVDLNVPELGLSILGRR